MASLDRAALVRAAAEAREKFYYCDTCRNWPGVHLDHRDAAVVDAVVALIADHIHEANDGGTSYKDFRDEAETWLRALTSEDQP